MVKINSLLKGNITIPNILSILRIFLIFPFIAAMNKGNYVSAGSILVISGLSDLLDGFIARNFNQKTKLGQMLDPAADKITLISVMICVGIKFSDIIPFIAILILKEICMIVASIVLIKRCISPPAAKWYGKLGTVAFYISITIIVSLKAIWNIENIFLNITLMEITALLMLYALVKYFRIFVNMIK